MKTERLEKIFWPAVTIAVLLAAWHVAVRVTKTNVFPSPLAVARAFGELGRRGVLVAYTRDSLVRVGGGYGLALLLANAGAGIGHAHDGFAIATQ